MPLALPWTLSTTISSPAPPHTISYSPSADWPSMFGSPALTRFRERDIFWTCSENPTCFTSGFHFYCCWVSNRIDMTSVCDYWLITWFGWKKGSISIPSLISSTTDLAADFPSWHAGDCVALADNCTGFSSQVWDVLHLATSGTFKSPCRIPLCVWQIFSFGAHVKLYQVSANEIKFESRRRL